MHGRFAELSFFAFRAKILSETYSQSLATGRPPCILLPFVDCQFPRDEGARLNEKGKEEPGCECRVSFPMNY